MPNDQRRDAAGKIVARVAGAVQAVKGSAALFHSGNALDAFTQAADTFAHALARWEASGADVARVEAEAAALLAVVADVGHPHAGERLSAPRWRKGLEVRIAGALCRMGLSAEGARCETTWVATTEADALLVEALDAFEAGRGTEAIFGALLAYLLDWHRQAERWGARDVA